MQAANSGQFAMANASPRSALSLPLEPLFEPLVTPLIMPSLKQSTAIAGLSSSGDQTTQCLGKRLKS